MTPVDIEPHLIEFLNRGHLAAEAFAEVPERRPERFLTVERTGGAGDFRVDRPTVAVQAWAPTLAEAEALMRDADRAIQARLADGRPVTSCRRIGLARFPAEGSPRYQAVYSIAAYETD